MNNNTTSSNTINAYRYFKFPPGVPLADKNTFLNSQIDFNSKWSAYQNFPLPAAPPGQGKPPKIALPNNPFQSVAGLLQRSLPILQNVMVAVMGLPAQIGAQFQQTAANILSFFYGHKKTQNVRDDDEKHDRNQFELFSAFVAQAGMIQQPGASQNGAGGAK